MSPDAAHHHVNAGGTGKERAALDGDRSRRVGGVVVLGDDVIGPPEALIQPIGQHGAGAVDGLFRGLADEHQRAVPLALARRHLASRAQQHGHMNVVAAGVHHAHILALLVGGAHGRGVVEPGLLFNR